MNYTPTLHSQFISKKLKAIRKGYQPLLNLTQKDMGKLMGGGQSFYSSIERGKSEVTHGAICLMANLVNVSPLEIDPYFFDPLRFKFDGNEYLPEGMLFLAYDNQTNTMVLGNSTTCNPLKNQDLVAVWYLGKSSQSEFLDVLAYLINNNCMSIEGDILFDCYGVEKLLDSYFFEESEPDESIL